MDVLPDLPTNATAENVQKRLGRPWESDAEESLASDLLDDAWSYLLDDVPTLEERLEVDPRLSGRLARFLLPL